MTSRLNNPNQALTQKNVNTHIFTEFSEMNKETTQQQVLDAIKNINLNVGEIVVGDIAVESSDSITHTKLDILNTTLNNKTLSKTTSSIDISGQSVNVGNFPATQAISGAVSVSNFPTTQAISGSVSVSNSSLAVTGDFYPATQPISGNVGITGTPSVNATITGTPSVNATITGTPDVNIDASTSSVLIYGSYGGTVSAIQLDGAGHLDIVGSVSANCSGTIDSKTFSGAGLAITATGVGSNTGLDVNVINTVPISGNVGITGTPTVTVGNSSIDTHCYASSNGTSWHHLKSDTNGILNIHSMAQDGAGNDITSTVVGTTRGLDVNMVGGSISVSSVNIKDSFGNDITSLTTPSNCIGSVKTALYGQQTNNPIGDTSAAPHGITKIGLNNFVVNSYSLPVMCGGYDGTNTQGFKTTTAGSQYVALDTANNTIKLSQTGTDNTVKLNDNTVKFSQTGTENTVKLNDNTVKFSQTGTENNIKLALNSNGANGAIVEILDVSKPVAQIGVSVGSIGYSRNLVSNSQDLLTCFNSNTALSPNYVAQDTYIRNPATTPYSVAGLNVYPIYPKKIHYTLAGRSEATVNAVIMGGSGSQKFYYDFSFGLANPQTFSAVQSGGSLRTIKYHYVDSMGVLQTDGTATFSALNSVVTLTPTNMISINKYWIEGTVGLNEQVLIRVGTANTAANTIASADVDDYYNGVITVPNGYIGYLTNFSVYTPSQAFVFVLKWDALGNRSVVYNHYNNANAPIQSGSNGSLGGIFTAGESIAFGKSASGASIVCGNFVLEPI